MACTYYMNHMLISKTTGCPKKKGISKCCSVCSTAQLMLNLDSSILIYLKYEIHMFVPSTELFLSDISETSIDFLNIQFDIKVVLHHNNFTQAHKYIVDNGTHVE